MLRGVSSPGTVTVIIGLHAAPSARRVMSTPVVPQLPVRRLQAPVGAAQSLLAPQNGKHPGSSPPAACVYHQPVQTVPARHAPVASERAPGRQACVQNDCAVAVPGSPCVRHVDPRPPHWACSEAVVPSSHTPVQKPRAPTSWHASGSRQAESSGRHAEPAAEAVDIVDVQKPVEHVCPVAQRFPHDPQLSASEATLVHPVLHIVRGATHPVLPVRHAPPTQVSPVGQRKPHRPQLLLSV